MSQFGVLNTPLTPDELRIRVDREDYIEATVAVNFGDVIDGDLEELLDAIAEMVTGSIAGLTDVSYTPVGVENGDVVLEVSGHVEFDNL